MAILRIPVQLAGELLLSLLQGRAPAIKGAIPWNARLKKAGILQIPWALQLELEDAGDKDMRLELGESIYEGVTRVEVRVIREP